LVSSRKAIEVVSAYKILKALAHTGTFRNAIISAGLKKAMENITSPLHRSTLHSKEDKRLAHASAKEVLETLKLTKGHNRLSKAQSVTASQRSVTENELPEVEPRLSPQLQRSVSGFVTSPESSNLAFEGFRHARSLSESDHHTFSRHQGARLSSLDENGVATIEEENLTRSLSPQFQRSVPAFVTSPESSNLAFEGLGHTRSLSDSDHHTFPRRQGARLSSVDENGVATTEEENLTRSSSTIRPLQMPPRRRTRDDDNFALASATAAEENINLRERTLNMAPSTRASYRSVSGSIPRN